MIFASMATGLCMDAGLPMIVAVLAGIIVFCIAITIIKSRKNKNAEKNKA